MYSPTTSLEVSNVIDSTGEVPLGERVQQIDFAIAQTLHDNDILPQDKYFKGMGVGQSFVDAEVVVEKYIEDQASTHRDQADDRLGMMLRMADTTNPFFAEPGDLVNKVDAGSARYAAVRLALINGRLKLSQLDQSLGTNGIFLLHGTITRLEKLKEIKADFESQGLEWNEDTIKLVYKAFASNAIDHVLNIKSYRRGR
jgi:hypothetical protein